MLGCLQHLCQDTAHLAVIIVKVKYTDNTFEDVTVQKQKVHNALVWLTINNPQYAGLTINTNALNSLPDNGVPPNRMTVETDSDLILASCKYYLKLILNVTLVVLVAI